MSIPKEPRQQMINMMYLVLTALLALNISAEILNAFYLVKEGITETIGAIQQKNDITRRQIAILYERNPEKAKEAYEKSLQAQEIANELYTYVDGLERKIIEMTGGYEEDGKTLKEPKDIDKPTNLMLNQGKGDELQQKINETRKKFLDLLGLDENSQFAKQISLKAEDPPPSAEYGRRSWAEKNFQMVPAVAAVTILAAIKNELRNTEADVLNYLLSSIGATDIKVDKMESRIIAKSNYITLGQDYEADIFVAAWSSTQQPVVLLGEFDPKVVKRRPDGSLPSVIVDTFPLLKVTDSLPVVGGMGKLKIRPTSPGQKKYTGVVKLLNESTGEINYYPFEGEFLAAEGTVVVSPDNLNVIYAGIDNPISVSVPGYPADKVFPSIDKGQLKPNPEGGPGKYIVSGVSFVPNGKVKITVSVDDNGTRRVIGAPVEFRIKRVPDPVAAINGTITGGKIKTGIIKNVPGIGAVLKDFDFKGVVFNITSYEAVLIPKRQDPKIYKNRGWKFSREISDGIKGLKPGDQVIFREIRAKGPDGTSRELNTIALEIE